MSRLDELIAELCPAGVSFQPLGGLLTIKNGKDHKELDDGDIPVYGSGGIMRYVDSAAAVGPSVLIPRKGSLSNVFYVEGPFWVVDTIFRTEIDHAVLEPKFVYYQLSGMKLAEMNHAGGVPSQTQSVLSGLRIPVPPLEVQREIVRILDEFTHMEAALEAELSAELKARRNEYHHHRDLLFESTRARRVALGELGTFVRGRRFTKTDVVEGHGIPSMHYGEIYTDYGVSATQAIRKIRPEMLGQLRFARPGDVVFAGVGETVEDVGKAVAWLGETPLAVHDDTFSFTSDVYPKYVAYAVQTDDFHAQKTSYVARGKVKRLSSAGLAKIQIPIPSPTEQRRIVEFLDELEALVGDLNEGLAAERAARRKQYEYYRDKLLTFKELPA